MRAFDLNLCDTARFQAALRPAATLLLAFGLLGILSASGAGAQESGSPAATAPTQPTTQPTTQPKTQPTTQPTAEPSRESNPLANTVDETVDARTDLEARSEATAASRPVVAAVTEADADAAPAFPHSTPAPSGGFEFPETGRDELAILDARLEPGTLARLVLRSSESFSGARVETPIVVIRGKEAGPTVCIVAGIHGDEINGVEVVRRAVASISPVKLKGNLIAVPIANLEAFRRGSRYLPDRRDLNRFFPGRPNGSSASRIAHRLFDQVIRRCDALVDMHTGSFHRSNLTQLRADLSSRASIELSTQFGSEVVVNSRGRPGTLRRAAMDEGIPSITVEAGEAERFDEEHIVEALGGIYRLLEAQGMIDAPSGLRPPGENLAYLQTSWIRCDQGGILVSRVRLGDQVSAGQILGTISDPLSEEVEAVIAPRSGRLIGMALDQVVMPGFAAYHIGLDARPLAMGGIPDGSISYPEVSAPPGVESLDLEERPE